MSSVHQIHSLYSCSPRIFILLYFNYYTMNKLMNNIVFLRKLNVEIFEITMCQKFWVNNLERLLEKWKLFFKINSILKILRVNNNFCQERKFHLTKQVNKFLGFFICFYIFTSESSASFICNINRLNKESSKSFPSNKISDHVV